MFQMDGKKPPPTRGFVILWMWPPPSNSHHQDYYIFSIGDPYKPSLATVTGRGPHPSYTMKRLVLFFTRKKCFSCIEDILDIWFTTGDVLKEQPLEKLRCFPWCFSNHRQVVKKLIQKQSDELGGFCKSQD